MSALWRAGAPPLQWREIDKHDFDFVEWKAFVESVMAFRPSDLSLALAAGAAA